MRLTRARGVAAVALGLALLACGRPAPVVQSQTFARASGLFGKVAIVPFYPKPGLARSTAAAGITAAEAAELVSRFVAETLAERGIPVIPANDLLIAFEGSGTVVPRGDPAVAASLAAGEFGATAVVLGEVSRYREREGGARGSQRPASAAFQFTLYQAPDGQRVWSARFDETQATLTADPLRARQYPGSGTRFLSVAELARWGVEQAVDSMPPAVR